MAETLGSILLPTSNAYVQWAVILVVVAISVIVTRRLREVPKGPQNLVEMGVSKLWDFFEGILGKEHTKTYFPILATFFIFILVCNYTGELPGAGEWFPVPTSILATAIALGIIAFATIHTCGVKKHGALKYLRTFLKPVALMLPITLLEQIVRPISLSLRLYGNMYGEERVTGTLFSLFPLFLSWLMNILALMFGLIQAMVFTMLLAIFIGEAIETEEEEEKKEKVKKVKKNKKEVKEINQKS